MFLYENRNIFFMEEKTTKNCPFNQGICSSACALFINPDDLNELLSARLNSLGVIDKGGVCSLKTLAMSSGRFIFENTSTKRF